MAQDGSGEGIARVKAGLFQVLQDVVKGGQTNADLFRDVGPRCLLTITAIAPTIAA